MRVINQSHIQLLSWIVHSFILVFLSMFLVVPCQFYSKLDGIDSFRVIVKYTANGLSLQWR